jgi:hypothetical protein
VPRGEPPHIEGGRRVGFGRGEFAGRSFARGEYEYGGNDRSFRSQRSYGPRSPLRGTRSPPRGRVGVPPRRDRMDFANPTFEQMARHWFDSFCTNPSAESFCSLSLSFLILQVGGLEGFWLIDSGCSRHMTGDRRWFSILTPVMTKEYNTFGDNGRGRVL